MTQKTNDEYDLLCTALGKIGWTLLSLFVGGVLAMFLGVAIKTTGC